MKTHSIIISFLLLFAASSSFGDNYKANNFLLQDTVKSCNDCHVDLVGKKRGHAPVQESCENCHSATGRVHPGSDKGFELMDKTPDLCFYCHESYSKKSKHAPVEMGECSACHYSHSSDNRSLLIQPADKLCFECHDSDMAKGKSVHAPIAMGGCSDCHTSHDSDHSGLLVEEKSQLCFICHDNIQEQISSKYPHAVAEDCSSCHNSHNSSNNSLLTEKTPDLCYMCHDMQDAITSSKFIHKPMIDEEACSNCHSAHGSTERGIILKNEKDLCLSCHGRTYTTEAGKTSNIKQKLKDGNSIHAPVEEGCISCHNPHANNTVALLKGNFPEGTYASAKQENFALCFECHDVGLLLNETTSDATNFRNGNVNMHYLHIKGEKGRSCKTCHDVHGAKGKFLINDKVLFGNWQMDMDFEITENGGSCATGCHAKKEYDRTLLKESIVEQTEQNVISKNRYQNYTENLHSIDSNAIRYNEMMEKKLAARQDSLNLLALKLATDTIDAEVVDSSIYGTMVDADVAKVIVITEESIQENIDSTVKVEVSEVIIETEKPIIEVIERAEEFEVEEFQAILFNFREAEVNEKSEVTVLLVAEYLIRNPGLIIELHGHTDNVGNEEFNTNLSKLRAENVRNILLSRGIDANRIEVKGFGEAKPLISNTTVVQREQNRRVEFVIKYREEH